MKEILTSIPLDNHLTIINSKIDEISKEASRLFPELIEFQSNVQKAIKVETLRRKRIVPSIKWWQARLVKISSELDILFEKYKNHDIVKKWRPIYKESDDTCFNFYERSKEFINDCLNANEDEASIYNMMMSEIVLIGRHRQELSTALVDWPHYCLLTSFVMDFTCSQCDYAWQYQHKVKTRPKIMNIFCPHCGMTSSHKNAFLKGVIRKLSFIDIDIINEGLKSLCKLINDLKSSYTKDALYIYKEDYTKKMGEHLLPLSCDEEKMLNKITCHGEYLFYRYGGQCYENYDEPDFLSLLEKNTLITFRAINLYDYIEDLVRKSISFFLLDNRGCKNKIIKGDLSFAMENNAWPFVDCKFLEGEYHIDNFFIYKEILLLHPLLNNRKIISEFEYPKPEVISLADFASEDLKPNDGNDGLYYIYRIDWEFNGEKCFYIGQRKTKVAPERDTNYMGSGRNLQAAMRIGKLHDANLIFRKTILKVLPLSVNPLKYEQLAIDEVKELEPDLVCYNQINPHRKLAKVMREL